MTELLAPLAILSGQGEAAIWAASLVFLRVGAAMALLPAFGDQAVPLRVRLALTLALTAIVVPAVIDRLPTPDPAALAAEVIAGLALGLSLRLFVIALQIAGALVAQATTLSQMMAGAAPEPQPAISALLVWGGLALAMVAGLHVEVAALLIASYDLAPPGSLPDAGQAAEIGLLQIVRAFRLGVTLAMPFVLASLLYNLAIGIINRAMPQLMLTFVGAPALTLGGLVLMMLALPLMLVVWQTALGAYLTAPGGVGP